MHTDQFTINQWEIIRIITGAQWKENCYLVQHIPTREMLLIDPGGDAEDIIKTINLQKGIVKGILLTHAHHDHIGAVKELCEIFSVECYLHKADARLLRMAPVYAARFTGAMIAVPDKVHLYEDLPVIPFANCPILAIPTPGHTPGSICYFFGDVLFTGDTLLFEHVGRTDLPGGSVQEITQSISQLLAMDIGSVILFPGHGRPWPIEEAKVWWQKIHLSPPEYNKFEK